MWDAQWDAFSRRFHPIRVDLPGTGRSPYPDESWDPNEYIECLLDSLGSDKVAVVGVAFGGTLAIDFVLERPDRSWALVAASVAAHGQGDNLEDLRAAEVFTLLVAGRPARAADLFLDVWCPVRTSPELDARIRSMVHANISMLTQIPNGRMTLADWAAPDRVDGIQVPTLVIWGDGTSGRSRPALSVWRPECVMPSPWCSPGSITSSRCAPPRSSPRRSSAFSMARPR